MISYLPLVLPLVAVLAGCGGDAPDAATPPTEAPATFAEQVELGGTLYGAHCADCHGASGEGTSGAPRLVGLADGALPLDPPASAKQRTTRFETVADVAAFVVNAMPPNAPGSLSEGQYWSILAFDLAANGIDLGDQKLDAALATTLEIPRN